MLNTEARLVLVLVLAVVASACGSRSRATTTPRTEAVKRPSPYSVGVKCRPAAGCSQGFCNKVTWRCESARNPGLFFFMYDSGVASYGSDELGAARRALLAAAQMRPKVPGPWRWLALVSQRERDYRGCVRYSRRAVRFSPAKSPNLRVVHRVLRECLAKIRTPKKASPEKALPDH